MDFVSLKTRIVTAVSKYKYVWIVLLAGLVLMILPESKEESPPANRIDNQAEEKNDEERLADILANLQGAGEVKVMLTIAQGARTIYQTDTTYATTENTTDSRTQTILITDSQRNETGLIHQKNPPIYQGAIVLAEGADDPIVELSIVEAVSDVTGLGADRISVYKMQQSGR